MASERRAYLRFQEGGVFHWLTVTVLFLALTVVQTWPLVLHIDTRAIGWAPDVYDHLWNLWWVKEALFSLENPFRSDLIFYPQGTDLYMHTLAPVNGILSIPLQLLTGDVVTSWNILVLIFFTASGVGAYALAYYVTRDPWASLAGGVIFAFTPFVMTHLHGHYNIATTWPIPFFVLALLAYMDTARPRYAVIAGAIWALMTWNWLEFAIDSGILLLLLVGFTAFLRRHDREGLRTLAKGTAVVFAVWLPLSLPLLIPSLYEVWSGDISMTGGLSQTSEFYSADLLGFVTPSPLWGPGELSKGDFGDYPTVIGGVEGTVFLGILPLLLAVVAFAGLWRGQSRNQALFWAGVFVFFAVMALGPYLYIGGDKTLDIAGWQFNGLSMPFRIFKELPLVGLRRVPARMVLFAVLALSVLAPLGIAVLRERLFSDRRFASAGLAVAIAALALLEIWNPPMHLNNIQVPPIYSEIANDEGDFTVLDLPVGRITSTEQRGDIIGGAMANYSQITHGRATVGGYISRGKVDDVFWLREQPGIGYLSCPQCPDFPRPADLDSERVLDDFARLRIRYVILNLHDFEGNPTTYVRDGLEDDVTTYLEATLDLSVIERTDSYVAYRVPGVE